MADIYGQLVNAQAENLGADPATLPTGRVWFRTDLSLLRWYDGATTRTAVDTSTAQTLTNKTLTSPIIATISNTGTLTLPTSTDTLVGRATTDTLTNKTMDGGSNTFTNLPLGSVTGTVAANHGGTGVANNVANTITFTGAFSLGWTLTGNTSLTLPTSGTFAKNDLSNLASTAVNTKLQCATDGSADFGSATTAWGNAYAYSWNVINGGGGGYTSLTRSSGGATAYTLTLPNATDTLVARATVDTLSNKTLDNTNIATLKCTLFGLQDPSDTTKQIAFSASGSTTAKILTLASAVTVNRTVTFPDATDTLVGRATTDTLTNKTLTSPTLTTPVLGTPSSGTLTNCTGLPLTTGVTGTLGAGNGGTGVTSVTTAPTASAFAGWDANKNLSANAFIPGWATTTTAAGTTTLAVGDKQTQYFTGSTTQTVVMPVASTLVQGMFWRIINLSSGNVTVQSSGGNQIVVLGQNSQAVVECILTSGTTAASWNSITSTATAGTVTSVAMTVPGILSVAGSPVTTSGTLAVSLATQSANTVFAGPSSGGAVAPTFRALVAGDLPAAGTSQGAVSYEVTTTSKTGNWVANHSTNASTNITIVMTRVSDVVTLTIPVPATLTNTDGTDNFMTFSQVLDNAYTPSTIRRFCSGQSFNNGANLATPAMLEVNTSGHLILYRDGAVTAWSSGVAGSGLAAAMNVTYKL